MQAAASYVIAGVSAAYGAVCRGATPVVDQSPERYDNHLEPFSLIVSLAVASLLPMNTKPSQIRHHIEWERPCPLSVGVATLETQGMRRGVQNLRGTAKAGHQVIKLWESHIIKAIAWYRPHDADNLLVRTIFQRALAGLEKMYRTYENEKDQTPAHLRDCIRLVNEELTEGRHQDTDAKPMTDRIKNLWDPPFFEAINRDLVEAHRIQNANDIPADLREEQFEIALDAIMSRVRERCVKFYDIIKEGPGY